MRKWIASFIGLGLIIGVLTVNMETAEAGAKVYKNCTELNKVYPGGVAISAKVKNKGGKTKYKPFVSKLLYNANSNKDRDKDGIACER